MRKIIAAILISLPLSVQSNETDINAAFAQREALRVESERLERIVVLGNYYALEVLKEASLSFEAKLTRIEAALAALQASVDALRAGGVALTPAQVNQVLGVAAEKLK